eukprot:2545659-Prymnesium_polylepis.4
MQNGIVQIGLDVWRLAERTSNAASGDPTRTRRSPSSQDSLQDGVEDVPSETIQRAWMAARATFTHAGCTESRKM